jgi:hypothetical protein
VFERVVALMRLSFGHQVLVKLAKMMPLHLKQWLR